MPCSAALNHLQISSRSWNLCLYVSTPVMQMLVSSLIKAPCSQTLHAPITGPGSASALCGQSSQRRIKALKFSRVLAEQGLPSTYMAEQGHISGRCELPLLYADAVDGNTYQIFPMKLPPNISGSRKCFLVRNLAQTSNSF